MTTTGNTSIRFGWIVRKRIIFVLVPLCISVFQIMVGYFSTKAQTRRAAASSGSNSIISETLLANINSIVALDSDEEKNITAAPFVPEASIKYLRHPSLNISNTTTNNYYSQPNSTTSMVQENTTTTTTIKANEQHATVTTLLDEQLQDIKNGGECGFVKCFFQSKSDPEAGYLLSQYIRFSTLKRTYALSRKLKNKYGVENLLIAPPRLANISEPFAAYLNANKTGGSYNKRFKTPKLHSGKLVAIQKVKVVPKPYIIVGCLPTKAKSARKEMKKKILPQVTNPELFMRNLEKGIMISKQIVSNEACLLKDWQAMMDLEGNIYQLDLDRCFQPGSVSLDSCSRNMEELVEEAKLHFTKHTQNTQVKT